ncbi:ribokinase [Bifidobacterium callimiconis]|uniref:Ribokinase n=1 Tax=Bifidobacterium callimiconis TaxID=2306973 RepID=A0A430FD26_9BIFI|nr:ribokinase [Bifidobacterium callimiconis]MBT1176840.1 ribokinase [Bifidobacterium callimiconis]RSX50739.1 sugar kinase [Bifidobacterium callimiconis]
MVETLSRDEAFSLLDSFASTDAAIAVVGSMNADYTVDTERLPGPGETVNAGPLRVLPGGKSGNQAASAAKIGAKVRLLGAVGQDANAEFLLGELRKAGVDVSDVLHVPGPSGTTVITVDAHGENTIVYSPGSNAHVDVDYIRGHADVITDSAVLGLCLESPLPAVIESARIAHEAGVKVLVNDSPFIPELPADLIANSDILLVNEHEMSQLLNLAEPEDGDWDGVDWTAIASALHDFGYEQAVITLGGDGSVVIDGDQVERISPVRVDAVDTTGCGDSFMGTILAGLASGLSLGRSAQVASYVSAYAATGSGAQASYGDVHQIRALFGA